MALLTISGQPGTRWEDVASAVGRSTEFELVTESSLTQSIAAEFGEISIPEPVWRDAAVSILGRMAMERHLVVALPDAELLFPPQPSILRVRIVAARDARGDSREATGQRRKLRFGRSTIPADSCDLLLNAAHSDVAQMSEIVCAAVRARGMSLGPLAVSAFAGILFETRLRLARHGIVPAGCASARPAAFGHPSEAMFANLLDFYRIPWEYEPRSFPLQWGRNGEVTEAFTPDFYLSEFDLYVELTTMKQSLVTRKNRKVRMLLAIYPHVNIRVFYQKDFQELVSKYSLQMAAS